MSTNAGVQVPPQDSPLLSSSVKNVEKPVDISLLGGFFENKSVKWLAARFITDDSSVVHIFRLVLALWQVFGDYFSHFLRFIRSQSLGICLTVLRQGLVLGTTAFRRRMLVSLEINNKDRSYEWFLGWMAHRSLKMASSSSPSTPWIRSHQLSVETLIEQRKNGSSSAIFKLVAGPGTHWFTYRGAWMQVLFLYIWFRKRFMLYQVKRERETRSMQLMSGVPWETVTLTTLSRDRVLFSELLSEARDLAMRGQEGKLVINTAWGIEWKPFGQPRQKRPLRSVVLEPGVCERIERDIKSFLERRKWYADRG